MIIRCGNSYEEGPVGTHRREHLVLTGGAIRTS